MASDSVPVWQKPAPTKGLLNQKHGNVFVQASEGPSCPESGLLVLGKVFRHETTIQT